MIVRLNTKGKNIRVRFVYFKTAVLSTNLFFGLKEIHISVSHMVLSSTFHFQRKFTTFKSISGNDIKPTVVSSYLFITLNIYMQYT